jgi:DNA primase
VLYHLPEVLEAKKQKRVIFLVEGEKDADNLRALGFARRPTRAARRSG